MAASQFSDVEILVHVAAPSRVVDDAAYRQLAQAYLSFQPENQIRIPIATQQDRQDARGENQNRPVPSPLSQDFAAVASAQPEILESQDLSFQSALDNRSSPRLRCSSGPAAKSPNKVEEQASSQNSWCAPPSQISDSYPLPDARILHVSPTRVLERYLKSFNASSGLTPSSPCQNITGSRAVAKVPDEVDVPSSIPVPNSEDGSSQSLGHLRIGKTIPLTPHPPESQTKKRRETIQEVIDETRLASSAISHTSAASKIRAESAPPLPKRQKSTGDEMSSLQLLRSSSDTGPNEKPPASSPSATIREFGHLLEIRPPSPPVGVEGLEPSDLVSEKLAKLARDLSSRYRPVVKRSTDPLERGYWLLDCRGWGEDTRMEAWIFLANYLRSGLAGWGVWCRRDSSHNWIRLYCWAHVAKHTYLLLYLASGRHMKTTGAQWLGADGEVILDVLPTER